MMEHPTMPESGVTDLMKKCLAESSGRGHGLAVVDTRRSCCALLLSGVLDAGAASLCLVGAVSFCLIGAPMGADLP